MWEVSAGQLNRLHSEQLSSGLALPRRRDRPVVGTHDVRGRYSRPRTEWARFLHGAFCIEHQPRRQCGFCPTQAGLNIGGSARYCSMILTPGRGTTAARNTMRRGDQRSAIKAECATQTTSAGFIPERSRAFTMVSACQAAPSSVLLT
jgi:hypothetical protein